MTAAALLPIRGAPTPSIVLAVGSNPDSSGTYSLGGGTGSPVLSARQEYVGSSGVGAFIQGGGTNTVTGMLALGDYYTASGAYNLSDGSLSTPTLLVGTGGSGEFTQSGGTNTVDH